MASQFKLYRQEIYNFLKSMTIKLDRLGVIRNKELQYTTDDIDFEDRSTWPYYINMIGEYHSTDTMMQINSIDTDEVIDFTKENLLTHTRTSLLYKPGLPAYKALENRYPEQLDLIRSIVYPVPDMDTALAADDFTLLAYDTSFLPYNERSNMVEHVQNFLDYNTRRWYVPEFSYEELYPIAFWCIIWYNLSTSLFSKRIKNIKTPFVHPFHVWEYLKSKGLGDYRDILTNDQALFLYRNIDYILKNKGKESTLLKLAENLLKPLRVTIAGKKVYHSLIGAEDNVCWTPEIISDDIADYSVNRPGITSTEFESVWEINQRLREVGMEDRQSVKHIDNLTDTLTTTPIAVLPTKLVELKKYTIDNKYENLLHKFILDTLIQRLAVDKVNYDISFLDETSGVEVEDLNVKDALVLLYYVHHRSTGVTPESLPHRYTASSGYIDLSRPDDLPTTFGYANNIYRLSDHIDIDSILSSIKYESSILNRIELMDLIIDQFDALIKDIRFIRSSSNRLVHKSMAKLYNRLIPKRTIPLELSQHTEYTDWFEHNPTVNSLVSYYEGLQDNKRAFSTLATDILRRILPLSDSRFMKYLSVVDSSDTIIYDGLKNLFVQLCSYNVAFLDTQRDSAIYFFLSNLAVDFHGEENYNSEFDVNPFYSNINISDFLVSDLIVNYEPVILEIPKDHLHEHLLVDIAADIDVVDKQNDYMDMFDFYNNVNLENKNVGQSISVDSDLDIKLSITGEE